METKIVLGSLFGDEGKGVSVQWLCKNAVAEGKRPLVIRYTGGSQAGHTVENIVDNKNVRHVFSSFGSASLMNIPTLYKNTALIDPICIVNEWNVLKAKGIVQPLYNIENAMIITPYDVEANRNSAKNLSDGTCGKGVYMAWKRSNSGAKFTINDNPEIILAKSAEYYNVERYKPYDEMFLSAFNNVKKNQIDIDINDYDTLVYESTQGLLLDAKLGFLPHVTATLTGLQYLTKEELKNADVYLAMRTYLTRHGNGYIPQMIDNYNLNDKSETNVLNQYQGNFKTGIFDFDLLNEAIKRHNFNDYPETNFNLTITHLDTCLNNQKFIYKYNNDILSEIINTKQEYNKILEIYKNKISLKIRNTYYCDSSVGEFEK
ncbi:MAG: adenylosuccinate synthetase [Bacteroidales bacterium]|nr:adenylosuccinate synthetase [Bacteroidales bacterium]